MGTVSQLSDDYSADAWHYADKLQYFNTLALGSTYGRNTYTGGLNGLGGPLVEGEWYRYEMEPHVAGNASVYSLGASLDTTIAGTLVATARPADVAFYHEGDTIAPFFQHSYGASRLGFVRVLFMGDVGDNQCILTT